MHTPTPTLYQAVTQLYEDLREIEQAHDELTDTQVREALSQALWQGFVKPVPGYTLPETFYMFTAAANAAVHRALFAFLWRCSLICLDDFGPGDRSDALETLGGYIGVRSETTEDAPLTRSFIQYRRSWYRTPNGAPQNVRGDVSLGVSQGDTSLGVVHVEWVDIGDEYAPRLVAFNDAWAALAAMPDVIAALGEHSDRNLKPAEFCELLITLGFEDATPLTRP